MKKYHKIISEDGNIFWIDLENPPRVMCSRKLDASNYCFDMYFEAGSDPFIVYFCNHEKLKSEVDTFVDRIEEWQGKKEVEK